MALEHAAGRPASVTLGLYPRYHAKVFLTPPWQEIFVTDEERRHSLDEAIAEYERLVTGYGELGYETVILPLTGVSERADLVLHHLNDRQS